MNEREIFRELSFGLHFNHRRFQSGNKALQDDSSGKTNCNDVINSKEKELTTMCEDPVDIETEATETTEPDIESDSQLRKKHRIFTEGSDIPNLLTSFHQLETAFGLPSSVTTILMQVLKFTTPTPIQMQAITALLHRRELLACAPTGSGKTLAFLIPAISHCLGKSLEDSRPKTKKKTLKVLILSPTRELADQIFKVGKQLLEGDPAAPLLKMQVLDKSIVKKFQTAGSSHGNKYDILVSTPNRLVYLLNHDPPLINLSTVEWLFIDESDKLFEANEKNCFREQLGSVYSSCTSKNIRRAMFSATFAFDVQEWCHMNMDNVIQINIGGKNTAVKSVDQKLLFAGSERGKLIALRDLIRQGFKPPALIFVQSKERAKELFAELIYDGINVDVIHADRTPTQRENSVTATRTGKTWLLICTELMGRGIDIKGVNLVVNYDFPTSAISYIHRIGRTGRAGRHGEAVTFFTEDDKPLLRSIANVIKEAGCPVPDYMLGIKKLSKDEKKKAMKSEVKRETIRTTPKCILESKSKRKPNDKEGTFKNESNGKLEKEVGLKNESNKRKAEDKKGGDRPKKKSKTKKKSI